MSWDDLAAEVNDEKRQIHVSSQFPSTLAVSSKFMLGHLVVIQTRHSAPSSLNTMERATAIPAVL